ncbi:phage integrase N-terminal SAM-like domain-containing protein [bacterium]|nr:phage integrase N-terminal SAM-like domain-containing protein [bacterium]
MERDLQIRVFSPSTQYCYLNRMKAMLRFFMRSPDELTLEDIHEDQQHLARERKIGWATYNQSVAAIRFFFAHRRPATPQTTLSVMSTGERPDPGPCFN